MPALVGRGSPGHPSKPAVRTPRLVLEHLQGAGVTGDYEASIHHAVKAKIRDMRPGYQWPRSHSFRTLLRHLRTLGLIEPTGVRELSPVPHMDPAIGFEERDYVRLTLGSEGRWEWDDPYGALRLTHYLNWARGAAYYLSHGLPIPSRMERGGTRSGLAGIPGLTFVQEPSAMPIRPAIPRLELEPVPEPGTAFVVDDLDEQRKALQEISVELGRMGSEPELFIHLDTLGQSFVEQAETAGAIWSDNARDLRASLGTLARCVSALQAAGRSSGPNLTREKAISDCRSIAKSLARLFARPLKSGRKGS